MAEIVLKCCVILGWLVCMAAVAVPARVYAECRVVEYPDHSEVVCDDDTGPSPGQTGGKEKTTLETTRQKEFVFYAPVRPVSRVTISADVSPFAIASPGDTLLFYQAEELRDRVFTPASATFVYEGRNSEVEFTIRQDGTANSGISPAVTNIKFSDRGKHLLLFPFKSGCPSDSSGGIYLKMNRFEGSQLYYQVILPSCLSTLAEQSIKE